MSTNSQLWNPSVAPLQGTEPETEPARWYAVHTRSRHEKVVAQRLQEKGMTTFLPIVSEVRRWSDRQKTIELPLFSCYVFVKFPPTSENRLHVLRVDSVLNFVGIRGQGTPIPDEQINAVRTLVEEQLSWHAYPFLKIGQRVRIRDGALTGVEGILVSRNGDRTLVVSVDAIERSLCGAHRRVRRRARLEVFVSPGDFS